MSSISNNVLTIKQCCIKLTLKDKLLTYRVAFNRHTHLEDED